MNEFCNFSNSSNVLDSSCQKDNCDVELSTIVELPTIVSLHSNEIERDESDKLDAVVVNKKHRSKKDKTKVKANKQARDKKNRSNSNVKETLPVTKETDKKESNDYNIHKRKKHRPSKAQMPLKDVQMYFKENTYQKMINKKISNVVAAVSASLSMSYLDLRKQIASFQDGEEVEEIFDDIDELSKFKRIDIFNHDNIGYLMMVLPFVLSKNIEIYKLAGDEMTKDEYLFDDEYPTEVTLFEGGPSAFFVAKYTSM